MSRSRGPAGASSRGPVGSEATVGEERPGGGLSSGAAGAGRRGSHRAAGLLPGASRQEEHEQEVGRPSGSSQSEGSREAAQTRTAGTQEAAGPTAKLESHPPKCTEEMSVGTGATQPRGQCDQDPAVGRTRGQQSPPRSAGGGDGVELGGVGSTPFWRRS